MRLVTSYLLYTDCALKTVLTCYAVTMGELIFVRIPIVVTFSNGCHEL